MSELNDWFLSLPEARQAVLRDDKWFLAEAAFAAGKAARAQPAQAGQVLTDDQWQLIADITESFLTRDMKNEIEAVLAKRVPMTDDTALIRQLAAALDRCRFDSLNMSVADMRALSEARTAASKRLCIVGEKGCA